MSARGEYPRIRRFWVRIAAVAVAMVPFALVTLAAATSAAAGADAVAAATMNADRSPETLLGDDTPVDLSGSTPELGDRRTLAKKRGCNPKKNTSCCRTPRRTPPRAAPPATHRGQRIYPADVPAPSGR